MKKTRSKFVKLDAHKDRGSGKGVGGGSSRLQGIGYGDEEDYWGGSWSETGGECVLKGLKAFCDYGEASRLGGYDRLGCHDATGHAEISMSGGKGTLYHLGTGNKVKNKYDYRLPDDYEEELLFEWFYSSGCPRKIRDEYDYDYDLWG